MATATGNYAGTGVLHNVNTGLAAGIKSLTIVDSVTPARAYTTDALQAGIGSDKFLHNFTIATGIKISAGGIFTLMGTAYNTANRMYYWEANA